MSRVASGVVVLMALCTANIAAAAERGFYIGASAGRSEYRVDDDDLALPLPAATVPIAILTSNPLIPFGAAVPGTVLVAGSATPVAFAPIRSVSFDRSDSTWSLTAGYRVNDYLSFELSYLDLGEIELRNLASFTGPVSFSLSIEQDVQITGVSAAVLGTWPISERWSIHALGGYEFTDSEGTLSLNDVTQAEIKDSSENFVVGVGVDFAWTPHWSLRATAERHLDVGGDVFRNESDADVYRLAVLYRL
jgi:opacity protein-like surface antigen